MKKIVFLIAIFCSSCVSYGKRYIEISPRYATLGEDYFKSSVFEVNGVPDYTHTVLNSDLKGLGGQISFIETTNHLYSRVGFFYTQLSSDTFSYSINNSSTAPVTRELTNRGFEADLGVKLWHFTPYITVVYSNMSFKDHPEMDVLFPEKNFLFRDFSSEFGGGLAIDVPLTNRINILLNGRFLQHSQIYSVGLLIGGWEFGDKNASRKSESRSKK